MLRLHLIALAASLILSHDAHATSLFERALAAAKSKNFPMAVSYANTALENKYIPRGERETMIEARDSYAERWVLLELAKLGPITEANAERAFGRLRAMQLVLRDAKTQQGGDLDAAFGTARDLLLARIATLTAAGDLGQAAGLLAAVQKELGNHFDELVKLQAKAFQVRSAEARAAAGHPAAQLLHLAAAARFGSVPSLEAARQALAPTTQLQVTASATGACFGKEVESIPADKEPGIPVHLDAQLSRCVDLPSSSAATSALAPYTRIEVQMMPRWHASKTGNVCDTYTNSAGTTVKLTSSTASMRCPPEFVRIDDPPERHEIRIGEVDHVSGTVTTVKAAGHAHVTASWPGGTFARDLVLEGTTTFTTFSLPEHAPVIPDEGSASPAVAQADMIGKVRPSVLAVADDVRKQLAGEAIRRAAAESDPFAAEDDLAMAALIAKEASPELRELVKTRYHIGAAELDAALLGKPFALPDLEVNLELPKPSMAEIDEDAWTETALYFDSATGRSAMAFNLQFGYGRSDAPMKAKNGSFVFALDYFGSFSVAGPIDLSGLFDFRGGTSGYVDTQMAVGGGVNLHGLLIEPMAGFGLDKLGTPDEPKQPNLQYNVAFDVELALRLGLAIPHYLAVDAMFTRRRRIDTDVSVENIVDLALRIRPVIVSLKYTQFSPDTGDYFGGLKLAHAQGSLLEILVGAGY